MGQGKDQEVKRLRRKGGERKERPGKGIIAQSWAWR